MDLPISLSAEHWATICTHLTAELPNEGCGLLAGRDGHIHKVYLIANVEHSPIRYEMEPGELIHAIIEIEDNDWDLMGIFHSHPAGPPRPSATDIAQAYYPDSAYLICSPIVGEWQARAFKIREGIAQEIALRVEQRE